MDIVTALIYAVFGIVLLFPLWLALWAWRIAVTEHTSLAISKAEQRELESLFAASQMPGSKKRPEGRALYRKRMWSAYGFAVYPNGIEAKWCLGRFGRYRFVPFEDIDAIYPIEMTIRTWWLRKRYDGVQVETKTGLTFAADTIRHDVERVRLALRGALGVRYDALYRPNEPLKTGLFDGRLMLHNNIRQRRSSLVLEKTGPWAKPEAAIRGALLLEETPAETAARIRPIARIGILFCAPAPISVAAILALGSSAFTGTLLICALGFALPGSVFLYVAPGMRRPARLYENGFDVYNYKDPDPIHYSWAPVTKVEKRRTFLFGENHWFSTATNPKYAQIPAGMPFGDRAAELGRAAAAKHDAAKPAKISYAMDYSNLRANVK